MHNASDAPEAVFANNSQKEVVYQLPQSPPGEYHPVQQSPVAYPQQQSPVAYPQQQQQQQQQQPPQQHEGHGKPFEGSGYYHNGASSTPSQYHVPTETHQERKEKKTVCGLARRTFICLIILAVVVVVAAVGGAVGGSLAVQRSSQPQAGASQSTASSSAVITPTTRVEQEPTTTTSGSSSTPTSSFVSVPSDYGQLGLDCPNLNQKTKKVALGSNTWSFALECGVDYPGAKNDILAVTVYTLDDCLRSCLSYNRNLGRDECVGVAFNADMANNVEKNFGNCWVKNSTSNVRKSNSNRNVGALLQLQ